MIYGGRGEQQSLLAARPLGQLGDRAHEFLGEGFDVGQTDVVHPRCRDLNQESRSFGLFGVRGRFDSQKFYQDLGSTLPDELVDGLDAAAHARQGAQNAGTQLGTESSRGDEVREQGPDTRAPGYTRSRPGTGQTQSCERRQGTSGSASIFSGCFLQPPNYFL